MVARALFHCKIDRPAKTKACPGLFVLPLIFIVTWLTAQDANAETITLKSGKKVEGHILQQTDRSVQVDVGLDVPITYYSDEIKDISKTPSVPDSPVAQPTGQLVATISPQQKQADRAEQQGLGLIDLGQMDDGLESLREAIRLDPTPNRHLNLGSILVGNGVTLQKQGKADEAMVVFRQAEDEIQAAIKGFDPSGETTFISDAYNLLGEMYVHALNDPAKAKMYFEKSLSFFENPAAKRALANLP